MGNDLSLNFYFVFVFCLTVPRPNVFIYFSPLHINVDQRSCLWLMEFVYGVVHTINMELAVSVHDEGKTFIVSLSLWLLCLIDTHGLVLPMPCTLSLLSPIWKVSFFLIIKPFRV